MQLVCRAPLTVIWLAFARSVAHICWISGSSSNEARSSKGTNVRRFGVSANLLHGFERVNLQNWISFLGTWRVGCSLHVREPGGCHDALPYRASHHPRPRPPHGAARR